MRVTRCNTRCRPFMISGAPKQTFFTILPFFLLSTFHSYLNVRRNSPKTRSPVSKSPDVTQGLSLRCTSIPVDSLSPANAHSTSPPIRRVRSAEMAYARCAMVDAPYSIGTTVTQLPTPLHRVEASVGQIQVEFG